MIWLLITSVVGLWLSLTAKYRKDKFTIVRRRGDRTERVEFEIGEKVYVVIQKERKKRLPGTILDKNKRSVYVHVPKRGKMWIHKSNVFKDEKED